MAYNDIDFSDSKVCRPCGAALLQALGLGQGWREAAIQHVLLSVLLKLCWLNEVIGSNPTSVAKRNILCPLYCSAMSHGRGKKYRINNNPVFHREINSHLCFWVFIYNIRILNYLISSESYFICPSLNFLVIMDDNSTRFMEYRGI